MSEQLRRDLYEQYGSWKNWAAAAPATADKLEEFQIEMSRAGFVSGSRVLEIGFGQGHFLDWARSEGFEPLGIERVTAFIQAAKARGHQVYSLDEAKQCLPANSLAGIAAFDVFEHLTSAELGQAAADYARWLKPGGRLLARFPNAASPFGRAIQYGDATHVSNLSSTSFAQIFASAGFKLLSAHDSARPWRRQNSRTKLMRLAAYGLRDVVNTALSMAYYARRQPLDPNVTVVLELSSPQPDANANL